MGIFLQSELKNPNIDDDVLVSRCRRGDNAALERLILKYQKRIYNIIYKICSNPDDSAELTQDTFVKVIENIDKFEGRSGFYTWIFRIAVNLTLNRCKKSLKLHLRSMDEDDAALEDGKTQLKKFITNERCPDPATVAENRELCSLVSAMMMKLDDDQRAVLVLRDIEGMSYSQISSVTGLELGTVKSRISRARANLRDFMETIIS